jgi:succinoglycan biosynthesis protein ExoO
VTVSPLTDSREAPDVSFVIAAFNVEHFIETAIRSALEQTRVRVEVIVIDDASTDGTARIVERLFANDARVTLVRCGQNSGPGAARNSALRLARGDWIAILDGDDFLLPGRSRTLLDCAMAMDADIVGDNFERVTIEGRPTGRFLFNTAQTPFHFHVDTAEFLAANQFLAPCRFSLGAVKVMVRRSFLSEHSITHLQDVPVGEDFHFILSCLLKGASFVVSSSSGYKYRIRPGSQSWRLSKEHLAALIRHHAATEAEVARSGCSRAQKAAGQFGRALVRSYEFVRIVGFAKNGRWWRAMISTLSHPRSWALVLRFAGEAVWKRLQLVVRIAQAG